jgi:peptide/nickel transport system permease protein
MTEPEPEEDRYRSLWGDVWAQYKQHKGALIGTVIFALIVFAVVIGPYIHTIDRAFSI